MKTKLCTSNYLNEVHFHFVYAFFMNKLKFLIDVKKFIKYPWRNSFLEQQIWNWTRFFPDFQLLNCTTSVWMFVHFFPWINFYIKIFILFRVWFQVSNGPINSNSSISSSQTAQSGLVKSIPAKVPSTSTCTSPGKQTQPQQSTSPVIFNFNSFHLKRIDFKIIFSVFFFGTEITSIAESNANFAGKWIHNNDITTDIKYYTFNTINNNTN